MANTSILAAFERMWQHVISAIGTKSDLNHTHNDIYYTEAEVDSKLSGKSDSSHKHDSDYDSKGTATSTVNTHNTSTSAHNDIRNLITGLTTRLNALADSDDTTLDQLSEIVAYIKNNKSLIESVTTSKINVSDIVNDLTTNVSNKPLSAAQGVAIKSLIDALQTVVNGKVGSLSDLGITATATELNHVDGVTSNIQTQLDGKAANVNAKKSAAGLMSADDKKKLDVISCDASLGDFGSKTVADLQTALDTWLDTNADISNASVHFGANTSWVTAWNSGNTAATIVSAGGLWTVTVVASYILKSYVQLRISYYGDKEVYYVCRSNGVWGNAYKTSFTDEVNAVQTQLDGKEPVYEWGSVVQGSTWSRLCLVTPKSSVIGSSFILSVAFTRSGVVGQATFFITISHAATNYCNIVQLSANNYTSFSIRGICNSSPLCYIELYDSQNITASSTQNVTCRLLPIMPLTLTTYKTFTTGESIPSGYVSYVHKVTIDGAVAAKTFVGNLSGNASSADKVGSTNVGSATQPIYLNAGTPTATTYTLGKSVPSDAKFTDTTYSDATKTTSGLMSANDKVLLTSLVGSTNLGKPATIGDLKSTLDTWLSTNANIANASAFLYAASNLATLWNTKNDSTAIGDGPIWTVSVVGLYVNKDYIQLRLTSYIEGVVFYIHRSGGNWGFAKVVAFANEVSAIQSQLDAKSAMKTLSAENLNDVVTPGFYNAGGGNTVTNKPSGIEHFGLYVIKRASGSYYTQILIGNDKKSYRRHCENGTWGSWSEDKLTDTTYTHPTSAGNKHIPSGGSSGQFLKWSADGTATWASVDLTVDYTKITFDTSEIIT